MRRPNLKPFPFQMPQAQGRLKQPIRATLHGSDEGRAEGMVGTGASPVLALCRKLIQAGVDPARPLEAYRGDILCLSVRSIGEAARLTVKACGNGKPAFALDRAWRGFIAPPVRCSSPPIHHQQRKARRSPKRRAKT